MKIKLKNTKLLDEYKRPILFFHTSPVENIKRFYPLSHFGTKKSANMRGMHYAYKTLGIQEPENLPDELPKTLRDRLSKLKSTPQLFTYPVYLYSKSNLKMPDLIKHSLEQFYNWFSNQYTPKSKFLTGKERLEGDAIGETKTTYKKALTEFVFIDPFLQSKENLEKELYADSLYFPSQEEDGPQNIPYFLGKARENIKKIPFNLAEKVALQRMIHFFEGEGYDTFSYQNTHEDVNQTTYIIFRPEQVFHQNLNESEHLIPPKNTSFLEKVEKEFFKKRQILSPSQRIKLYQETLRQKIQKIR